MKDFYDIWLLGRSFAADAQKRRQWRAFVETVSLDPGSLDNVIEAVAQFIMPHAIAAARALGEDRLP